MVFWRDVLAKVVAAKKKKHVFLELNAMFEKETHLDNKMQIVAGPMQHERQSKLRCSIELKLKKKKTLCY